MLLASYKSTTLSVPRKALVAILSQYILKLKESLSKKTIKYI